MSFKITLKQRRNAERELTSAVCAGCDGPKRRGAPFCRHCSNVLADNGLAHCLGPVYFAEQYTEGLTLLLSRKGQQLRQRLAA